MSAALPTTRIEATAGPQLQSIPQDIVCVADYERYCKSLLDGPAYEYLASGAADEITLNRNQSAYTDLDIMPRVLRRLEQASTETSILGQSFRHPVLLAPLAHQRLFHPDGELTVAAAAAATDTCFIAGTLASVSLEALADISNGHRWFQLYWQPSRQQTLDLIRRAEFAGYSALVVTVDAPVNGPRNRIQRAGFKLPEYAYPENLRNVSGGEPIELQPGQSPVFQGVMASAPDWNDLQWLASQTRLPVLVKGVLHSEDALMVKQLGLDGVIVSNHGGRCLDTLPASIEVLPEIREVLGADFPVLVDGGVRRGSDVFKAIALGADAVLVGRPQAWASAVAGALGVAHMVRILREELELTMALAGVTSISKISRDSVRRRRVVR